MASAPLRFVAISGSLRAASVNSGLVRFLVANAPETALVREVSIKGLPLFSADLLNADGTVPAEIAAQLLSPVEAADGVIIASPEHNFSMSAATKNAIDWLSRPAPGKKAHVMGSKPVHLVGAGGRMGTVRAQAHIRGAAVFLGSHVFPGPETCVNAFAGAIFDKNGDLIDPTTKKIVLENFAKFVDYARLFKART
eukprot:Amastigsp_a174783_217.p1 type:complete len:196 gc:universal Amastigsp_a174783_217:760-173(-)